MDRDKVARRAVLAGAGVLMGLAVLSPVFPAQAQGNAQARRAARTEVVLLRGLFNIFSYGMDDLAAKLERAGARTQVDNHAAWREIADAIAARARTGSMPRRLVLIGHSLGANDIFLLANRLGEARIAVDLMVSVDPTVQYSPPPNVRKVVNYYQSGNGFGVAVTASGGFRGVIVNADLHGNRRDLGSPEIGHASIDKSPAVHREIIRLVSELGGRTR